MTAAYWARIQIPGRSLQTLLNRQSLQFFNVTPHKQQRLIVHWNNNEQSVFRQPGGYLLTLIQPDSIRRRDRIRILIS